MPLDQTTLDNASARSLIWMGLRNVAVRALENREVELVLSRVWENSSGRPG